MKMQSVVKSTVQLASVRLWNRGLESGEEFHRVAKPQTLNPGSGTIVPRA